MHTLKVYAASVRSDGFYFINKKSKQKKLASITFIKNALKSQGSESNLLSWLLLLKKNLNNCTALSERTSHGCPMVIIIIIIMPYPQSPSGPDDKQLHAEMCQGVYEDTCFLLRLAVCMCVCAHACSSPYSQSRECLSFLFWLPHVNAWRHIARVNLFLRGAHSAS